MRYEEEITPRSVLAEALKTHEGYLEVLSKAGRKLEPAQGCERRFDRERRKCQILRELIRAMESDVVRSSIAQWQREEMTGEKQTGLFSPEFEAEQPVVFREAEDGYPDENVPDHPEE